MNENIAKFISMTFVFCLHLRKPFAEAYFRFHIFRRHELYAELTVFWCYILVNLHLLCQYIKFH